MGTFFYRVNKRETIAAIEANLYPKNKKKKVPADDNLPRLIRSLGGMICIIIDAAFRVNCCMVQNTIFICKYEV